ncbi:pyridoxamine 5'-phosphate oxidase family protein [Bradyrhizobium forestalis]|nr:pyridoxamine 5'-phosphate oxidase family protein [Bradyrhizobium forestalis]
MPEQHRDFFANLGYVFVGSADRDGLPSASVLTGPTGFLSSPDPGRLLVRACPSKDDPLSDNLVVGAHLGLLGLDLTNRRRNRLNGRVASADAEGFEVHVHQSFGNCPKYIQVRQNITSDQFSSHQRPRVEFKQLDEALKRVIQNADTFFVASCIRTQNGEPDTYDCDISHRGGRPGFVLVGDREITVPDFSGNLYYNTLGNFSVHPYAALLIIDFLTGDLVHIRGRVEILWSDPRVASYSGAQWAWRVYIEDGYFAPSASIRSGPEVEFSPFTSTTGLWRNE